QVGGATLRVIKRTRRCNATQVNPITAERDADPVRELLHAYGHADLGVHTEVIESGRIAVGDTVAVLP
ncbi:MAG: MOSC domain-containing protein, partial [Acetobacteraceae bacterium]|nr:MOSC domain-containing protein [Acetobacteraceae bacterium]